MAVNHNKPFRVITRTMKDFKSTVVRAKKMGYVWIKKPKDNKKPYCVVFYPRHEDGMMMCRQMTEYLPNTRKKINGNIRLYTFLDFVTKGRARKRRRSHAKTAYPSRPVKGTDKEGNEYVFRNGSEAAKWLKENRGKDKAKNHAIYQAIQPCNRRRTAYGMKWEYLTDYRVTDAAFKEREIDMSQKISEFYTEKCKCKTKRQ